MEKLQIYNAVRKVPTEAMKTITGGRLSGKTDINPMWRIKTLTEQFGACGIGWYYIITDKRLEKGANGEIAAFVDIQLFVNVNGEWSAPIAGTGGNMFVSKERNGLYTSDECFKMALTDAISVACKALGVGADVYWDKDRTKYDKKDITESLKPTNEKPVFETPKPIKKCYVCDDMANDIYSRAFAKGISEKDVNTVVEATYNVDSIFKLTTEQGNELIKRIEAKK
jgi:hypothetical protein